MESTPVQPQSLLSVRGLTVSYEGTGGADALTDVDLDVRVGEITAVIGQSGSGKSTLAKALLRLLPESATSSGIIEFAGRDFQELNDAGFRAFRGKRIGFIPQDPGNSLNPVREIGSQALEAAHRAGARNRAQGRELVLEAFERVGLPDPETVFESYPHQLSGGSFNGCSSRWPSSRSRT
jgi:peptide/nickel transport system ATP-binding protein